jgi:hypothetical protein
MVTEAKAPEIVAAVHTSIGEPVDYSLSLSLCKNISKVIDNTN